MNFKRLLFSAGLFACIAAEAEQLPLHRDMRVLSVNADTRRTELIFFPDEKSALSLPFEESPFYLSLNGIWDFRYADSEEGLAAAEPARIRVPGNWEFQGFGTPVYINWEYEFAPSDPRPPLLPEKIPAGEYSRTFSVPQSWKGRDIYLNVCGAKAGVYIYVNGNFAGYSEDSKNTSRYDIGSFLKEGENLLTIKCLRWSTGSFLECQDFWRVSGIERDVYLSSEQKGGRTDFTIVSTLDDNLNDGLFSLSVNCSLATYYKLLDKDGSTVAEGFADVDGLRIPSVRKWSAESPELYTLLLRAGGEYTRFDVGFRRLEIKGNVFFFNGQPIKFKGVNLHEHNEFTGHYVSRDYLRRNLLLMRELNINAVRTSHYPQPRYFYELCDSLGFYVYDEANLESHGMGYGERSLAKDPAWYEKHLDRVMNMYARTANYPCVTLLSPGNEAGNGINFERIYDVLKALESKGQNRPVVYERAGNGRNTDFLNPMYPDTRWLREKGEKGTQKPVVLCEYSHAMGNSNGSLDYMWKEFYAFEHLQGGFIWDWMDQGIAAEDEDGKPFWKYGGDYGDPEADPPQWWKDRNFCCNGIVAPDLTPHPGAFEVKYLYQNAGIRRGASENVFTLFNRNYFVPLNADLQWEIFAGGESLGKGGRHFDVAPQSADSLSIALPVLPQDKTCYINFRLSDAGASSKSEIAFGQILLSKAKASGPSLEPYGAKVSERGEKLILRGRGARLTINKKSGFVESYRRGLRNLFKKDFGLRPNFWRASTDNDWGNGGPSRRYAEWKENPSVASIKPFEDEYGAGVEVRYSLPDSCALNVVYRLSNGGNLRLNASFEGGNRHTDIPRIGFRTRIRRRFSAFTYFGRGPHENYSDRSASAPLGIYSSDARNESVRYVRPQETGHHTGAEWLEIGGMRISSPGTFEFNALPFSIEDCDPRDADGGRVWGHINDIGDRNYVELCLDGFMTGVGGYDSWGSVPEADRTVWADRDYSFCLEFGRK